VEQSVSENYIWITRHAQKRMQQRQVSEGMLLDLIETGTLRRKDDLHAWIFKYYPERTDNLICAAVALNKAIVVKTIMHHFQLEG
jgi:hypothetical protein